MIARLRDIRGLSRRFWKDLDFDRRCFMVEQMSADHMGEMFLDLDLENRTQIISMVNDETRSMLESKLDDKGRNELFFYEHFTMEEKTNYTPKDFLEKLVRDHYDQNNQEVPFDKIDDGYIQVIQNTKVKSGFITVQVVEPKFKTSNIVFDTGDDYLGINFESDEAREAGVLKKKKNDTFRMNQNRYG